MDPQLKKELKTRLRSAQGHLGGIERMIEEDVYCIDIIRQIQAVQRALHRVAAKVLDNHLRTCVTRVLRSEDAEEQERVLQEILDVFEVSDRI